MAIQQSERDFPLHPAATVCSNEIFAIEVARTFEHSEPLPRRTQDLKLLKPGVLLLLAAVWFLNSMVTVMKAVYSRASQR